MVRFLVFNLLICSSLSSAEEVPKVKEWFEKVKFGLYKENIPRRYLILKKKGGKLTGVYESDVGLLMPLPKAYLGFKTSYLKRLPIKDSPKGYNYLLRKLPIDRVLIIRKDRVDLAFLTGENKKLKTVELKDDKGSLDWDGGGWFANKVGYAAVVLARQDSFLLVEAFRELPSDAQALAIKDSKAKITVEDKQSKGSGLIQLIEADKYLGVFEIVVSDESSDDIGPGTKLILGKGE